MQYQKKSIKRSRRTSFERLLCKETEFLQSGILCLDLRVIFFLFNCLLRKIQKRGSLFN
jgi:hypothetical protein